MRTDPRAAEVRTIVERVFGHFLIENGRFDPGTFPNKAGSWKDFGQRRINRESAGSNPRRKCKTASFASPEPAFPRLFTPELEIDGGSRNSEEARTSRPSSRARGNSTRRLSRISSLGDENDGTVATSAIDETVLIDRGRYVARTYRTAGMMAMWLIAVGIVQFYDDQGDMLGTVNLYQNLRPERMTA
jgi:hypothetical protein